MEDLQDAVTRLISEHRVAKQKSLALFSELLFLQMVQRSTNKVAKGLTR